MKSGGNCLSGFREEDVLRFHDFKYENSPGARVDNPQNFDSS